MNNANSEEKGPVQVVPVLSIPGTFGAVAISGDGRWAASSGPGELRVWNLMSRTYVQALTEGIITSVSIAQPAPDHLVLFTGEWAGTVTRWTVRTKESIPEQR